MSASPAARWNRLARLDRGWLLRWVALPALVGGIVSPFFDLTALPIVGPERLSAVFLTDGSAYYGHLQQTLGASSVTLHEAYYFQQAPNNTGLQVALVRRGTELHDPADGMRIRVEKILAIERVGAHSTVAQAIAADRMLGGAR
ncbi:MAG: hypothetical protein WCL53_06170 [Chloroflexota bacterium]